MRIIFTDEDTREWLLSWRYRGVVEEDAKELFERRVRYSERLLILLDDLSITESG